MQVATIDRGEIIHIAGAGGLSPALSNGAPVLAAGHDASQVRCGWEEFFAALEKHRLALACDPDRPDAAELVPADGVRELLRRRRASADALGTAARFLGALLGPEPGPPGS